MGLAHFTQNTVQRFIDLISTFLSTMCVHGCMTLYNYTSNYKSHTYTHLTLTLEYFRLNIY